MKNTVKSLFLTVTLAVGATVTTHAQTKIGYMNANLVLADMTEMKAADSELSTLSSQLQKQDSLKVMDFQRKYQELAKKEQEGTLSPKQLQEESQRLEMEKAEITKFEQEMTKRLQDKRAALYQPIYDRVNKAISEVAKEKGYAYVIDATAGSILYADEANDLSAQVRAKMGLPPLVKK
jgi:outer membrane protein